MAESPLRNCSSRDDEALIYRNGATVSKKFEPRHLGCYEKLDFQTSCKVELVQTILWLLIATIPAVGAAETSRSFTPQQIEFFEQKIRPVLVERCYECHSAESKKPKGDFLLDTAHGLLKGGETGPAIIPGDPDKSLLIIAVRYKNETRQMPPKAKLSDQQIADLETWVKMGAPDPRVGSDLAQDKTSQAPAAISLAEARQAWAYRVPANPTVPAVKGKDWIKSPIDAFILAKLEQRNLSPAPRVEKRTLIRRATFDLVGLPPTPEDIESFLNDESPEAFAKVVDKLLASPAYGERWGRHWLDVVRYADSLDARFRPGGLGVTADISEAYRYRDWVVAAFNRDLSYQDFIRQQIAGDLLVSERPEHFDGESIVATSMLSIGRWEQGCSDKEKMLTDVVDDQVDVTSRAFLGLTVACARCHDHKFDPISTEDYYGLAGIFFSSHALPVPGPKGGDSVRLRIPLLPPAEIERRKKREARIAELEKQIQKTTDESISALAQNLLPDTARYLEAVWAFGNRKDGEPAPVLAQFAANRKLEAALLQQWMRYLGEGELRFLTKPVKNYAGAKGTHLWQTEKGLPWLIVNTNKDPISLGSFRLAAQSASVHPSMAASVAVAWKSPIEGTVQVRGQVTDGDPNCGNGVVWSLDLRQQRKVSQLATGTIQNNGNQLLSAGQGAEKLTSIRVSEGDMIQLAIHANKGFDCDTTQTELEIIEQDGQKRVWNLARDIVPDLHENGQGNPHSDGYGHPDVWCFYELDEPSVTSPSSDSALQKWFDIVGQVKSTPEEIQRAAGEVQQALLTIRSSPASENKTEDKKTSKPAHVQFYEDLTKPNGKFWQPLRSETGLFAAEIRNQLADSRKELTALQQNPPPPAPMAHGIQEGGVPRSMYEGLKDAKIHIRGRYDRLGKTVPRRFPQILAGENQQPITEGSGRRQLAEWIASPENPLTARVMVNRIWQYHFGEGIVRTASNFGKLGTPPTHPELLDHLAHAFVQSGWSIKAMHRLIMLSSVYQQSSVPNATTLQSDPDNTLFGWMNRRRLDAEALRDSLLAVAGNLDATLKGPATRELGSPRRTLYLMAIRSDRNDFRTLFDAADPMAVTDKRTDSTVAPQALFLLNDPFVQSQTKALGQRLTGSGCQTDEQKIAWLYQRLYGRPPTQSEIGIGRNILETVRAASGTESTADRQELAWQRYCHVLVCANEFMYVD